MRWSFLLFYISSTSWQKPERNGVEKRQPSLQLRSWSLIKMEMENLLIQVCYDLKFAFVSLLFLLKSCAGICPGEHGKKIKCANKIMLSDIPTYLIREWNTFKAAIMINWLLYNDCLGIFNILWKMQKDWNTNHEWEKKRVFYYFRVCGDVDCGCISNQ